MKNLLNAIKFGITAGFISASSFAMAAGGEGRNGPDQGGTSIPIAIDQFIKASQMKRAILNCQQDQEKLLLTQIFRQDLKYKINSFGEILLNVEDAKNPNNSLQVLVNSNVEAVYVESMVRTNQAGNKFQLQSHFPTGMALLILPKEDPTYHPQFRENKRKNINTIVVDSSVIDTLNQRKNPWVRFIGGITVESELLEATKYQDNLGFNRETERLVTHISVKSRPIVNEETNQLTELQVDEKEFSECLFNQVNPSN